MIEGIRRIRVQGGYFSESVTLQKFPEQNSRVAIIYGENGSGKSSLAEAFHEIKTSEDLTCKENRKYNVEFLNKHDEEIDAKYFKDEIYTYNEDFIDHQVKYASDGLGAVVMFGKQVEIDGEIEKVKENITNLNNDKKSIELELEDKEQRKESPRALFQNLKSSLQKDDGWADLDKDIKGQSVKSSVTKKNIDRLFNIEFDESSKGELKENFKKNYILNSKVWPVIDLLKSLY